MGKGSQQQATPTTTTVNQNNIPSYAQPYLEQALSQGQALSQNAYTPYPGSQLAPLTNQQYQAVDMAGNLPNVTAGTYGNAQGSLNSASQAGANAGSYQPGQISTGFTPTQFSSGYNPAQYGGSYNPSAVSTQSWLNPGTAQAYMDPYQSAVTQQTINQINQEAGIQNSQIQGNAAAAGAFGGDRQTVAQGLNNYYTQQAVGQAAAAGGQAAYASGQNQFNAQQQASLQAQQANLQSQQFGANLGTQQASQAAQYGLTAQQQQEQANQFGAQYAQQGQTAQNQANLSAAQLGLQGGQLQATAGQDMGYLGSSMGNTALQQQQALQTSGGLLQAQDQSGLNIGYQNFLNQLNYPYQQLGFESGLINGLPLGTIGSTSQYQNPNQVSQMLGLGLGGLGLSQATGGGTSSSDRRLKTDIVRIGTLASGLPVYQFRYKKDPAKVHFGVMSDEVARVIPDAVSVDSEGFDVVDYLKVA